MLGSNTIAGCILAGGLSRRMGGGDKSLMKLAGKPMLAHVANRLGPQVSRLLINANGAPDRFAMFGLPVVPDSLQGHLGPLSGVHAGLRWLEWNAPEISYMVTVSADAPLIPRDLVARLAAAVDPSRSEIAIASSDGKVHPVIALWPVPLAADLEAALQDGTRKVLHWTARHTTHEVTFTHETIGGTEIDPFFNANTPNELTKLESLLSGPAQ